jgi:hypothetical protein
LVVAVPEALKTRWQGSSCPTDNSTPAFLTARSPKRERELLRGPNIEPLPEREQIDESCHDRAMALRDGPGHVDYGQGSSREHGALVPAYVGPRG